MASLALLTSAAGLRRGYLLSTAWNKGLDVHWQLAGISAARRAALLTTLGLPLVAGIGPMALLQFAWTPVPSRLVLLTAVAASAIYTASCARRTRRRTDSG